MPRQNIIDALWGFIITPRQTNLLRFYGLKEANQFELFKKFLYATNDAVRLDSADKCVSLLLSRGDNDSLMHFHRGLLRRELASDIDYYKHRDHASHTLHNFLLGFSVQ